MDNHESIYPYVQQGALASTLGNNSEFIHPDWVARPRLPFNWSSVFHVIANRIYAATQGDEGAASRGSYLINLFQSLLPGF